MSAKLATPAFDQLSRQLLAQGKGHLLAGMQRGIEKEGLRVDRDGLIAQTPHPAGLGAALTHPHITTDYSEALLELITRPHSDYQRALDELLHTHRWVYQCLDKEIIWPGSMPCKLAGERSIPIARYGDSNIGKMKYVYRQGLGWRYGRTMQSIAGIHYNFSLPQSWWQALYAQSDQQQSLQDFISAAYIALLRNFRRHAWLLIYLFGASPALDASFFAGKPHQLPRWNADTLYQPHATCLRMTDLGYKSSAQETIRICYNQLSTYIDSLRQALTVDYPAYAEIGIEVDGEYRQLNNKLLQIENEFYSEVRPKRTPQNGEKALSALEQHGIEYIEVRLLDINPLLPLGLDLQQMQFIDTFLLHCLLTPSPPTDAQECQQIEHNIYNTAQQGRDPSLQLTVNGRTDTLPRLAQRHLNELQATAAQLDQIHGEPSFSAALRSQQRKLGNSQLLPSQQLLDSMRQQQGGYADTLYALAQQHQQVLKQDLSEAQVQHFQQLSEQSRQQQAAIEAADTLSFADYLAAYFAQPPAP